ncbi:MAG: MaoC family dehydratase N-terminal domain-containing protein [Actinomycetota bacterium]|nr:MaoC family dehydratase N-terminal domain-containing protein [Actinomycetota bacterium]
MIDHKWIGKTYGPMEYEIGREKIKEYAAATKDSRPVFHDREFAKNTSYGDIIAMPNFAAVYGLRGAGMLLLDQEIKLNLAMLVHGAQEFEWFDVIKPNDVITETGKVADIYEKGDLAFIVYEGEAKNQDGKLVCRSRATFIIRGGGS